MTLPPCHVSDCGGSILEVGAVTVEHRPCEVHDRYSASTRPHLRTSPLLQRDHRSPQAVPPTGRVGSRTQPLGAGLPLGATRSSPAQRLATANPSAGSIRSEDRTVHSSSSHHGPATPWLISPSNRSSADRSLAVSSTNTSEPPKIPGRDHRHNSGTPQGGWDFPAGATPQGQPQP